MSSINEILEFDSPLRINQGYSVFPKAIYSQVRSSIEKLVRIKKEFGEIAFHFDNKGSIPDIYRKFKIYLVDKNISFSKSDLGTLTFSLSYSENGGSSIFSNPNELDVVLAVLSQNWHDRFLLGLIDTYLLNWDTENRASIIELGRFLTKKLDVYSGNSTTINSFKKHIKYFDINNGDVLFGVELAIRNILIKDAATYLSLPDSKIIYPYFSRVIVSYLERKRYDINSILNEISDFLVIHNSQKTNKRILSKLIIQANQTNDKDLQDKVKDLAFKFIGDPEKATSWTEFYNISDKERIELKQAKVILNEWITKQFINVFFDVCINDVRRKQFWLKFVPKIRSFKVYGPAITKLILQRDKRIALYVDSRFETVLSKKEVSAFILYIGNYMLIEFSHVKYAFYAYKVNGVLRPSLDQRLNTVDELRNSTLSRLIQNDYQYMDEGRMDHRDGLEKWESKFDRWISNKVIQ
jgi:hypothetical protein